jgi:hypothetical protein
MKLNTVILNGIPKYLSDEDIEYLKQMYGDWEKHGDIWVFNRMDFITVDDIAKTLNLTEGAIYQRNRREPDKHPLVKRGGIMGIDVDNFLKHWTE